MVTDCSPGYCYYCYYFVVFCLICSWVIVMYTSAYGFVLSPHARAEGPMVHVISFCSSNPLTWPNCSFSALSFFLLFSILCKSVLFCT